MDTFALSKLTASLDRLTSLSSSSSNLKDASYIPDPASPAAGRKFGDSGVGGASSSRLLRPSSPSFAPTIGLNIGDPPPPSSPLFSSPLPFVDAPLDIVRSSVVVPRCPATSTVAASSLTAIPRATDEYPTSSTTPVAVVAVVGVSMNNFLRTSGIETLSRRR